MGLELLDIAHIAHEANRAYCEILGDTSQLPWHESPTWQHKSALAGVENILKNPAVTPEDSHKSWLAHKRAEGWIYGPVKDPERREHPCCVPFEELPEDQRVKDQLFNAVVRALLPTYTPQPAALPETEAVATDG